MAQKYYKSEFITGVNNTTVDGVGITSSKAEKKRVTEVSLRVSARHTDNFIEMWIDRERVASILTNALPLVTDAVCIKYPVDVLLEEGENFHVSNNSAGTKDDVTVVYHYETE